MENKTFCGEGLRHKKKSSAAFFLVNNYTTVGIIENNQYGSDRQCFLEGTKMKAYLRAT